MNVDKLLQVIYIVENYLPVLVGEITSVVNENSSVATDADIEIISWVLLCKLKYGGIDDLSVDVDEINSIRGYWSKRLNVSLKTLPIYELLAEDGRVATKYDLVMNELYLDIYSKHGHDSSSEYRLRLWRQYEKWKENTLSISIIEAYLFEKDRIR